MDQERLLSRKIGLDICREAGSLSCKPEFELALSPQVCVARSSAAPALAVFPTSLASDICIGHMHRTRRAYLWSRAYLWPRTYSNKYGVSCCLGCGS